MGLTEALSWLHGKGFQRVIVKLDCKAVVDNINGQLLHVIEVEYILQLCKAFLNIDQNYKIILSEDNQTFCSHPCYGVNVLC